MIDPDLTMVAAEWDAPANIVAFTTTRQGGVSNFPFDSFNLGLHVDDDPTAVARNRQRLVQQYNLPAEPVWLNQVHGTQVVKLDEVNNIPDADGVIATRPNQVCAIMTADCMPLFLCNRAGSKVALLHAGWQGMAGGMIEQGVAGFAEPAAEIIAWAGPTISGRHFEIGQEVRTKLGGPEHAYRPSPRQGKCYADLYALAAHRLAAIGILEFSYAQYCTYADADRFFSYRRDGQTGRMASIIYLRGGS